MNQNLWKWAADLNVLTAFPKSSALWFQNMALVPKLIFLPSPGLSHEQPAIFTLSMWIYPYWALFFFCEWTHLVCVFCLASVWCSALELHLWYGRVLVFHSFLQIYNNNPVCVCFYSHLLMVIYDTFISWLLGIVHEHACILVLHKLGLNQGLCTC